jgi:hypothetical protein
MPPEKFTGRCKEMLFVKLLVLIQVVDDGHEVDKPKRLILMSIQVH